MRRNLIYVAVLGLAAEKILQHGLTALFFIISIDGIGKPETGNRIFLSDPVMVVLNLIIIGFFVWGFLDIWKLRISGLYLVIIFSLFDIVAEFVFHGVGFITVSVIVAIFLIGFAFVLKRSMQN